LIAATLEEPRGHLHQGAVYLGVPTLWYAQIPLALRPRDEGDFSRLRVVRVVEDPTVFRGEDWVVASGKRRPVIVLSPRQEIRRQRAVRVALLYSYGEGTYLNRFRAEIENGDVPGYLHLAGHAAIQEIHDSVIDLGNITRIPKEILEGTYIPEVREVASLTDPSLALLIERARAYLALVDRSPAS
jgi:hypothetical protein